MKLLIQIRNGVVTDVVTTDDKLQEVIILDNTNDRLIYQKKKTIFGKYILDYIKDVRNHGIGFMRQGKDLERWM